MDAPAKSPSQPPAQTTPPTLRLTDFLDVATLQEIQDSFAAVANVEARITDADGNVLTEIAPTNAFVNRQRALELTEGPERDGREYVAPIMVNDLRLGTIRMNATDNRAAPTSRPAAIQFLYLLANAIARLCYQEFLLRQRMDELTAVYNVATMLGEANRDLPKILDRAVRLVAQAMGVKAASIRLIDDDKDELVTRAVFNLSGAYLNKGPMTLSRAEIDQIALSDKGYEYVANMADDPRTLYPDEAVREGIVSAVAVGMRYKGHPIGVLRIYTATQREFSAMQIELVKAIAAQVAAAIENARLVSQAIESESLKRQVEMASEVQLRMLPQTPPVVKALDLSSVYVPCFALGGDFYDTIPLPYDNVGLVVADVSGKGVPASLIMASVRAALRAQVDNVYYVYEVTRRLNDMLCRDTKPTEFVTLFYGVLDTTNKRLTYCNAGHPPPMLLRGGVVSELDVTGMVLGVSCDETYGQSILHLQRGDTLLLYTDGLSDAMNFKQERFGHDRIVEALKQGGANAEIIAQNILWTVRKFAGISKRNDDITMIVARIL